MEIRWTKAFNDPWHAVWQTVEDAGRDHGYPSLTAELTSQRENTVRFKTKFSRRDLADEPATDVAIRALLTLDPDAVVRTAKAIYNGRADFEQQVKTRCQQKGNTLR